MINKISKILVLLTIPLALPASGTEQGVLWQEVGLFHRSVSSKRCSSVPANKFNRVPGYENTQQKTDDCDYFFPAHTSLALHVFYIEWASKFGDEDDRLLNAINNLEIEYGTYQRRVSRVFNIDGKFRPKPTIVNGLTGRNGKWIFVWIGKGVEPKLHKTSFIHELVHVAIYAHNYGDHGDPDHEGSNYPGWTTMHTKFIPDTNEILKRMDL